MESSVGEFPMGGIEAASSGVKGGAPGVSGAKKRAVMGKLGADAGSM